jgi:hypothetical protein
MYLMVSVKGEIRRGQKEAYERPAESDVESDGQQ